MTLEELIEHLGEAGIEMSRRGDRYRGSCPSCGGVYKLSAYEDLNGHADLKCWARCERDDVLATVDLTWRDLRAEKVFTTKETAVVERNFLSVSEAKSASDSRSSLAWVWDGYVARSTSTLLAGRPKVGKSTLLCGLMQAMAAGIPFVGRRTERRGIVLLTEERMPTLHQKLDRFELDEGVTLLLRSQIPAVYEWPQVVDAAIDAAGKRGAGVLIIDVLDKWARIRGEQENSSGAMLEALEPLETAVAEGLAVVIVTHQRKSEGKHGDAVRGSNALTGAVDVVVELERLRGDVDPHARILRAESRFDETPEELALELNEAGYKARGTEAIVREEAQRAEVAALLTEDPQTVEEIAAAVEHSRTTVQRRLDELLHMKCALRVGEGKRGDPYKFLSTAAGPLVVERKKSAPVRSPVRKAGVQLIDDMVVFDTETTGLDPLVDELRLVCFARGGQAEVLEHPADRERIQAWLELKLPYTAHNINFDLAFLAENGYTLPPPELWDDTTLIAHVAGRRRPGQTALKSIAKAHVKAGELPESVLKPEQVIKGWLRGARREAKKRGQPRPELGDAPRRLLEPYLKADVTLTQWTHAHYSARLNGQSGILGLERRLLPAIAGTQRRGVPIDVEEAKRFRSEASASTKCLLEQVRELADDGELNPQSARQVEAALERRGADLSGLPRTEKTGQLMLTAQTLESIDDDLARALLELRAEKKMLDYAEGLFKHTHGDRLFGSFRQVGTTTGRMSSSAPNLQNIPKDDSRVRHLIRAPEGKVLVGADLDSIELRLLAHFAPGGALERSLSNGGDPHRQTAEVLGVDRAEGKRINYAVLYGAGRPLVAEILGCDDSVAKATLDRWYDTYPEVAQLKGRIRSALDERGYVNTLLGRQQYIEPGERYRALNYLIQGSAADLFKKAAIEVHEAGLEAVLYVHDEIVLEVETDQAERAGERLSKVLAAGAGKVGGLKAAAAAAARWSEFNR